MIKSNDRFSHFRPVSPRKSLTEKVTGTLATKPNHEHFQCFSECEIPLGLLPQTYSTLFLKVHVMKYGMLIGARGGLGSIVGWFIRIVIYDICITGISDILGVSRMVALLIFLGILAAIALGGYILKQRVAPGIED